MRYTTLLLCFCSILLLGSCKSQPSAQNGQPLEVMTFNVRLDIPSDSVNNWNYRKGDACRMIAYYSPDLLGMQEVLHNQMEDLKRGLPQYTALGVGRDDGKEAGEYCPYSSGPTGLHWWNTAISPSASNPKLSASRAGTFRNRVTTWAILQEKNNGQKFVYFNTHLDNDGKTARKEGVQLILDKIKEIAPDMPAIITQVTLTATPGEEPLQTLEKGGMENAAKTAAVTYGPSWSFHDFGRLPVEERVLLDYVFVTKGAKIDRYRVIQDKPENSYLSDHCPILVELTVQ